MVFLHLFPEPDIAALAGKRDITGLVRALGSRNPEIQSAAMHALGQLGHAAVPPLIPALKSPNRHIRLGAIGALAEIGDAGAVPALAETVMDPVSEIRWQAMIALGEMRSEDAIPYLLTGLQDADKYVRYGSALSLDRNGYEPPNDAQRAWYYAAMQDWERLTALGSAALPPLQHLLKDTDADLRVHAVRVLGNIGDPRAGLALVRSLGDADRRVRWEAALASQKCDVPPLYLPRGLYRRPRITKNPLVAGFLNFLLPGLGYGYLGKWWGIMIFQIDITITVWLFRAQGETNTYSVLFPVYLLLAIHAWYLARNMPEEPA
jgi:hypothetical protein